MYSKDIKTNDGGSISIQLPESAHDIRTGVFLELLPRYQHMYNLMIENRPIKTPYELLSMITGINLDELYERVHPDQAVQGVYWYSEAVVYHLQAAKQYQWRPKSVKVHYKGKLRTVSLKRMSMEPAGAFIAAQKIIENEILRHINQYGEAEWKDNFSPSFYSMAAVVDQFLYCPVTGGLWQEKKPSEAAFSGQLTAAEMFFIAGHFFRAFPVICAEDRSLLGRLKKLTAPKWREVKTTAATAPKG